MKMYTYCVCYFLQVVFLVRMAWTISMLLFFLGHTRLPLASDDDHRVGILKVYITFFYR
jgi:hypothetical protein